MASVYAAARGDRGSPAREGGACRGSPHERILDAAADLFYRKGVRAVGVDAIIAAASVAKASFYRHFHSKEELVVAWLRSDQARRFDRMRAETERRTSAPDERLLVFFDVVSEIVASPDYAGAPYLTTAAELREPSSPVRTVIAEYLMEVETYLGSLAAAAGLRSPQQLGTQLHLLCCGLLTAVPAVGTPAAQSEAARVAVRALVDAAR